MANEFLRITPVVVVLILIGACSETPKPEDTVSISDDVPDEWDRSIAEIVARHGVNTAGVAVIRDGEIAWSNHYGQQSPGVEASPDTLFHIASITKTIVAETVLRLVAEGRLSLDESMSTMV